MLNVLSDMVDVWAGIGGGEGARSCGGVLQVVSSHWIYDNPQRFEDQNILNVPNQCEHLVTFLKQTEGYLGRPGFGCTSPARDNSRSSGSKSGPVVSGSVE